MALSVDQKKVVKRFKEKYFEHSILGEGGIDLEDFLDLTPAQQITFIKTWAEEQYLATLVLEQNLIDQQGRVATRKTVLTTALAEWGIIV